MQKQKAKKPKDTPQKQHARFLETAREVGASDDPKAFEKAFTGIVTPKDARLASRKANKRGQ